MGCTDILGISEIRTGAKLIDIGVGPDPFKWPGKGGWEGVQLCCPAEKEQLRAWQLRSFAGWQSVESCVATVSPST